MRFENGYGSVSLIDKNSKRRKPYVVKIHVGYIGEVGKRHAKRKTIGYARTRAEGRKMLEEYHNNPYDTELANATWKYIYDEWFKYKKGSGTGKAGLDHYQHAYSKTKDLDNIAFKDITLSMYQNVVDNSKVGHDTQKRIRNLYHQLYEYAKVIGIKLDNDFSSFINIEKSKKSEKHIPFSKKEINVLFKNRNKVIDLILFMILTGIRTNEFFKISEITDDYIITGSKTEAGLNRIIPLHEKIKPIFRDILNSKILDNLTLNKFYILFKEEMIRLNLKHYPYDTRHTFATLAKLCGMNDLARKKILGHSVKDLTDNVYTHLDFEFLKNEINKITID